ncbi:MAG: hypothetical protein WAO17_15265, partial [Candidatus Sulfotelmatobacter sp.]
MGRTLSWLLPFLVISAAYLYAFPQPNIFYAVVVLLHALAGAIASILLIPMSIRLLRTGNFLARAGWLLVAAGAVLGIILIKTGTPRAEWNWLYLHIVISLAGVALLIAENMGRRGWLSSSAATTVLRTTICLVVIAAIGYGANYLRDSWQTRTRIQNPTMPPDNMNGEGDG